MNELTNFLMARVAEDEAVARAATMAPWALDEDDTAVRGARGAGPSVATTIPLGYGPRRANAIHIARHDPARVLAECAAKREVVELFETSDDIVLYPVVEALVSVYADHADFDSRWAS